MTSLTEPSVGPPHSFSMLRTRSLSVCFSLTFCFPEASVYCFPSADQHLWVCPTQPPQEKSCLGAVVLKSEAIWHQTPLWTGNRKLHYFLDCLQITSLWVAPIPGLNSWGQIYVAREHEDLCINWLPSERSVSMTGSLNTSLCVSEEDGRVRHREGMGMEPKKLS